MPNLNPDQEMREFRARKQDAQRRNQEYLNARFAFKGQFGWPRDWPAFKEQVQFNLVRKAVLIHANYLMGRGFTTEIQPLGPNPPQRQAAQRAEKALFEIISRCNGWRSIWRAAQVGSMLGTTGWKVYMKQAPGGPQACFSAFQPEYMFPVPQGDDYSELAKVFYAYAIDRNTAARQYGGSPESYKSEKQISQQERAEYINPQYGNQNPLVLERRIPVVEVWTDENYLLWVGGKPIVNAANPYGFVPYVVVPNIDSGESMEGLSDVSDLIQLNNQLNWLLSEHFYAARRWMNPTLVWEGAPLNAADIIARIVGGGGVLPVQLGRKVYMLNYQGTPPDIGPLIERLRSIGVEVSGLNELAWSGQSNASIQTGPSLEINFSSVLSTLSAKRLQYEAGLKRLFGMLLTLGSQMGDIGVVDAPGVKTASARGLKLSGKDIGDHRDVKIIWPGMMPKDDIAAANFELQKHGAGIQSKATTLEHLGFDFPDDELARIAAETQNPDLNPQVNANMMRAQAAQQTAQAKQDQVQAQMDQPQLPSAADVGQANGTPEGFGTLPDGTVVRENGSPLGDLQARLAQRRAEQMAQNRGQDQAASQEQPA